MIRAALAVSLVACLLSGAAIALALHHPPSRWPQVCTLTVHLADGVTKSVQYPCRSAAGVTFPPGGQQ